MIYAKIIIQACSSKTIMETRVLQNTCTLCSLSTVSTDCTCTCSDIVSQHCSCMLVFFIQIAIHVTLHSACRWGMAYRNTVLREPFSRPVNRMLLNFFFWKIRIGWCSKLFWQLNSMSKQYITLTGDFQGISRGGCRNWKSGCTEAKFGLLIFIYS